MQRVYFRTILPQSGSGAKTKVSVEAGYFATQEKEVMMDNDLHQRISVPNTRHIAGDSVCLY